jgi:hypothetical protein
MIFSTVEYDAEASLHLIMHQLINTRGAHSRKERHRPLQIFLEDPRCDPCINWRQARREELCLRMNRR